MNTSLSRIASRVLLAASTVVLPAACLAVPATAQAWSAEMSHIRGSIISVKGNTVKGGLTASQVVVGANGVAPPM